MLTTDNMLIVYHFDYEKLEIIDSTTIELNYSC